MVFLLVPSTLVWQHTLGTHCARADKTTARRAHTFNQNVSTFLRVFVHNGGWALRIVHPHIGTHNMAQTIRTPYACGRALPAQRFSTEAVFSGALSRPFAVRCTHTPIHKYLCRGAMQEMCLYWLNYLECICIPTGHHACISACF